jgi:hypothetical protein
MYLVNGFLVQRQIKHSRIARKLSQATRTLRTTQVATCCGLYFHAQRHTPLDWPFYGFGNVIATKQFYSIENAPII